MDYESLALEFFNVLPEFRRNVQQKKVNESMYGEAYILHYISSHDECLIPSDISNEMGISAPRMATVLSGMESKGYVIRQIDSQDRRRILITLTPSGKEQADKNSHTVIGAITGMLRYLGEKDAGEYVRITKRLSEMPLCDMDC